MPDLTPLDLEELKRLQAAAVERFSGSRLESDSFGLQIWADGQKGGPTHVLDVRGWGYLTGRGHGALGLTEDEGIAAQRAVQAYVVASWNALPALINQIEGMRAACEDALRFLENAPLESGICCCGDPNGSSARPNRNPSPIRALQGDGTSIRHHRPDFVRPLDGCCDPA